MYCARVWFPPIGKKIDSKFIVFSCHSEGFRTRVQPMRHDPEHRLPELLAGHLSIVTTLCHFRFKPIVVLWNQLICQLTNVPVEILALKRDSG